MLEQKRQNTYNFHDRTQLRFMQKDTESIFGISSQKNKVVGTRKELLI